MIVAAAGNAKVLWYLTRGLGVGALLLLTASIALGVLTTVGWRSPRWPRFATAGLHCTRCRDLHELSVEVAAGAGAVLLTEESLTAPGISRLLAVVHEQPSWSQLPVVLLMRGGARSESA